MIPHYFFIGVLVFLAAKEFREWVELILSYNEDNKEHSGEEDEKNSPQPIPENVKHMYS